MGAPTLRDRLNAAWVSCAAKLWSELLGALAAAGQCGAGMGCFPLEPPRGEAPPGADQGTDRPAQYPAATDPLSGAHVPASPVAPAGTERSGTGPGARTRTSSPRAEGNGR